MPCLHLPFSTSTHAEPLLGFVFVVTIIWDRSYWLVYATALAGVTRCNLLKNHAMIRRDEGSAVACFTIAMQYGAETFGFNSSFTFTFFIPVCSPSSISPLRIAWPKSMRIIRFGEVVWAHVVMNDTVTVRREWIHSSHQRMAQRRKVVIRGINRRKRCCIDILPQTWTSVSATSRRRSMSGGEPRLPVLRKNKVLLYPADPIDAYMLHIRFQSVSEIMKCITLQMRPYSYSL